MTLHSHSYCRLQLLFLLLTLTYGHDKLVYREHDFYTLQTTVAPYHWKNICSEIIRTTHVIQGMDTFEVSGNLEMNNDLIARAQFSLREIEKLMDDDFLVTDFIK
jgi:hypothetical protein